MASLGPAALAALPNPRNGSVVPAQVDYGVARTGQQPTPVKRPLCVADKTPASRARRDRAVPGDASDKQPERPPGGESDPLADMSGRNVEELIAGEDNRHC